jgi:glycerol-3-phosphate dehydrogenase
LPARLSPTKTLRLHGWRETGNEKPELAGYGSDAEELTALFKNGGEQLLHPRLPCHVGQVLWAVRQEMARTVADVLSRRLRALLLDASAAIGMAPQVARLMAAELGRDEAWEKHQVSDFRELARSYLFP